MSKNGKMFLFSQNDNIIMEASIDKIYRKKNENEYEIIQITDVDSNDKSFHKVVYISEENFKDMIKGNKNHNKLIFYLISLNNDHKRDIFAKIKNIFKKEK